MKDKRKPLRPKLRFPEFRDALPWESRELGPMTLKVGSGITPTGGDKNYKANGRPFVRSQNVGWGALILDDVAYIDEETHRSFAATEISIFDVLLNITGASIGRSAVADARVANGNVNQHVCIIRTRPDELNPILLNKYLISEFGQKQIDSFQAGGNRKGLNFAQIRSFLIPLPQTQPEQQKIADCLSGLDELIAAQARKVDALKTHKKGLMQQLFPREGETQPRLRFPEFRDAVEWKALPLSALAEKIMVGIASAATHAYRETGVPMLRNQNIKEGKIDDSSLLFIDPVYEAAHKGKRLRVGDVITVRTGYPGLSAVVTERYQNAQCFTSLITRPKKSILNPDYLCEFINSEIGKRFILGAEAGGAQKNVNAGALEALSIYLPELEEQRRIATFLSSLDTLTNAATQELETFKTHKKGLMQQLFPSAEAVEA